MRLRDSARSEAQNTQIPSAMLEPLVHPPLPASNRGPTSRRESLTYPPGPFGGMNAPEIWIRWHSVGEIVPGPGCHVDVYTARSTWTGQGNLRLKWEGTGAYWGDISRAPVNDAGYIMPLYSRSPEMDDVYFRIGTGKRNGHGGPIVNIEIAHARVDIQLPRVKLSGMGIGWYPGCADCGNHNLFDGDVLAGLPTASSWHKSGAYECSSCGSLYCDAKQVW